MHLLKHFITITKHRHKVMKYCFKIGLYKQGLLHDLSKYSYIELKTGFHYYQGFRSPIDAEKEEKGYSLGWLHHKGRNKHHFEYWIDYGMPPADGMIGMKMPTRYVVEMFVDRIAASRNYMKEDYTDASALAYYRRGCHKYIIHPETAALLEKLLVMLAEKGEEETFSYVRREVLHNV